MQNEFFIGNWQILKAYGIENYLFLVFESPIGYIIKIFRDLTDIPLGQFQNLATVYDFTRSRGNLCYIMAWSATALGIIGDSGMGNSVSEKLKSRIECKITHKNTYLLENFTCFFMHFQV